MQRARPRHAAGLAAICLVAVLAAALTGCGGTRAGSVDDPSPAAPAPAPDTTALRSPPAEPPRTEATGEDARRPTTSAAVSPPEPEPDDPALQRLLAEAIVHTVAVENSFGGADVFDGVDLSTRIPGAATPLGQIARDRVVELLKGVAQVRFIADPEPLIEARLGSPRSRTAVVYLERVVLASDGVTVDVALWCGDTCGAGTGYDATRSPAGWRITRIVPRWIS